MFKINTFKASEKLEKKLSEVGTTKWYAKTYTKRALKIALIAYAVNAKVQTARLLHSDAYQSRKALVEHGYNIVEDLRDDTAFHSSVQAYIKAKSMVQPEFELEINDFEANKQLAEDTKEEFKYNIQRIYNPFVYF